MLGKRGNDGNPCNFVADAIIRIFRYWPEFLIFTFAVGGSLLSYFLLLQSENKTADSIILEQARNDGASFLWALEKAFGDFQTVTAFMSVARYWRDDYFREDYNKMCSGVLRRSPGTQGLFWLPLVADVTERANLEEQQDRQLGLGGSPAKMRKSPTGKYIRCIFNRSDSGEDVCAPLVPTGGPFGAGGPGQAHAWFPIFFAEPMNETTRPLIMRDTSATAETNQSISAAILLRAPSSTPRIILTMPNNVTQFGLLVFAPVYHPLACNSTAAAACDRLAGLTMGALGVTDLAEAARRDMTRAGVRIDHFLLDLGPAAARAAAPLFLPGADCARYADYARALGVDELYASLAPLASAPPARARLAAILPAICRAAQGDPAAANGSAAAGLSGLGAEGAFAVRFARAADRAVAFVAHSPGFGYRQVRVRVCVCVCVYVCMCVCV
jgi:hypothetical protein